jgi:hypothetical protein
MIIGLTGCKGGGKDTVGQHLVDNYEFTRLAFADKLKEAVANLFNIKVEKVDAFKSVKVQCTVYEDAESDDELKSGGFYEWSSYSWREFLQRFGTEMGRNTFGRDFWVQQWEEELYRNSHQTGNVVATDVRFPNEAYRIIHLGGTIVEIVRPGYEPDGHVSEEPLQRDLIDAQIVNDGDIASLYVDVDELMKGLPHGG